MFVNYFRFLLENLNYISSITWVGLIDKISLSIQVSVSNVLADNYRTLNDEVPNFVGWHTDEPNLANELCAGIHGDGIYDIACDKSRTHVLCQRLNCKFLFFSFTLI